MFIMKHGFVTFRSSDSVRIMGEPRFLPSGAQPIHYCNLMLQLSNVLQPTPLN